MMETDLKRVSIFTATILSGISLSWEDAGALIEKTQVFFRQKDNCGDFLNLHDWTCWKEQSFYDKLQDEKGNKQLGWRDYCLLFAVDFSVKSKPELIRDEILSRNELERIQLIKTSFPMKNDFSWGTGEKNVFFCLGTIYWRYNMPTWVNAI